MISSITRSHHWDRFFDRYPSMRACEAQIGAAVDALAEIFTAGGKVLVCGNGGSAADSEHIVGELMKGFLKKRCIPEADRESLVQVAGPAGEEIAAGLQGALPAIALTSQVALGSAIANDIGSEMVFAQQTYGLGRKGDAIVGISTSGNSRNVLKAFIVAKALGLRTISLTGKQGGTISPFADIQIAVPAEGVVAIQELHLPTYHLLCLELEERFFTGP